MILAALVYVVAFNIGSVPKDTDTVPKGWMLIGETSKTRGESLKYTLSVYEVNVSHKKLLEAVENVIETCQNLTADNPEAMGLEFCKFNAQELRQAAENGRLAVIAVVVKIQNIGLTSKTFDGPGPYCGASFDIRFLEGKSNGTITGIKKPVTDLWYKVEEGKVFVGYGGFCQAAAIFHELGPGDEEETVYGFLVLKGSKLAITASWGIDKSGEKALRLEVTIPEE